MQDLWYLFLVAVFAALLAGLVALALGEPRVNVLELNLALDAAAKP